MTRFLIACEISLIEELWNHFVNRLFLEDLPHYENFSVQSNALFSLRGLIIGVAVGIIIAAVSTVYNKRYLGDFVRLLISKNCSSKDSALTLGELGCEKRFGIKNAIKNGGSLNRWVRCVEEEEFYEALGRAREEHYEKYKGNARPPKFKELSFKRNCKTMHFYVPEKLRSMVEEKYDPKGANWKGMLIVVGSTLTVAVVLCYTLPDALTYVDNFMTFINGL